MAQLGSKFAPEQFFDFYIYIKFSLFRLKSGLVTAKNCTFVFH